MALKYHPDKKTGDEEAMKILNVSKEILINNLENVEQGVYVEVPGSPSGDTLLYSIIADKSKVNKDIEKILKDISI